MAHALVESKLDSHIGAALENGSNNVAAWMPLYKLTARNSYFTEAALSSSYSLGPSQGTGFYV